MTRGACAIQRVPASAAVRVGCLAALSSLWLGVSCDGPNISLGAVPAGGRDGLWGSSISTALGSAGSRRTSSSIETTALGSAGSPRTGSMLAASGGQSTTTSTGAGLTSNDAASLSEVCDNNIDDDGDSLIDCEDPDCIIAGWVCRSPIPDGWLGPIAVGSAGTAAELPECSASFGYGMTLSSTWCSELSATPPSCAPCPVCGDMANGDKSVLLSLTHLCTGVCITQNPSDCRLTLPEGCNRLQLPLSSLTDPSLLPTVKVEGSIMTGGTCESSLTKGRFASPLDRQCREPMRACSGPSVGHCPFTGNSCLPRPGGLFGETCIYRMAANPDCPDGWNARRQVAYTDFVDTRTCSDCTCTPPTPTYSGAMSMTVRVTDFGTDSTCQLTAGIVTGGIPSCFSELDGISTDPMEFYLKVAIDAAPTSCLSGGGAPAGTVEGLNPVTICCAGP